MMNKTMMISILSLLMTIVSPAFGHAGHDHSHWSANMLHFAFYASLIALVAIVVFGLARMLDDKPVESLKKSEKRNHAA